MGLGRTQRAPADATKPVFSADQDRAQRELRADGGVLRFALDATVVYTLPALIDIAESRSPETKGAWRAAQARAAALGIAKSELYPAL